MEPLNKNKTLESCNALCGNPQIRNYLLHLLILVHSILEESVMKSTYMEHQRIHARVNCPHQLCSELQCLTDDTWVKTKVTFIVRREFFHSHKDQALHTSRQQFWSGSLCSISISGETISSNGKPLSLRWHHAIIISNLIEAYCHLKAQTLFQERRSKSKTHHEADSISSF